VIYGTTYGGKSQNFKNVTAYGKELAVLHTSRDAMRYIFKECCLSIVAACDSVRINSLKTSGYTTE
jgi:hypothetical protein